MMLGNIFWSIIFGFLLILKYLLFVRNLYSSYLLSNLKNILYRHKLNVLFLIVNGIFLYIIVTFNMNHCLYIFAVSGIVVSFILLPYFEFGRNIFCFFNLVLLSFFIIMQFTIIGTLLLIIFICIFLYLFDKQMYKFFLQKKFIHLNLSYKLMFFLLGVFISVVMTTPICFADESAIILDLHVQILELNQELLYNQTLLNELESHTAIGWWDWISNFFSWWSCSSRISDLEDSIYDIKSLYIDKIMEKANASSEIIPEIVEEEPVDIRTEISDLKRVSVRVNNRFKNELEASTSDVERIDLHKEWVRYKRELAHQSKELMKKFRER